MEECLAHGTLSIMLATIIIVYPNFQAALDYFPEKEKKDFFMSCPFSVGP